MALATIGESVVSKIIDGIIEKASSFLQENLLPDGDTEAELERLEDALPQIKAVLEAVESNQIKTQNKALDAWLWRFRDAVDCAEDVLDELAYYELEEKVQTLNGQASSSMSGYKRKLVNYVSKKFKDDTLTRLVKAVKGLDRAAAGVNNFLNLEKHSRGFVGKNYDEDGKRGGDRETGSLLTESVVFGRDKERDLVVEWLTADSVTGEHSSRNVNGLSAFTILGMGGLGKTTLAQLICKDVRVTQFFNPIIWVCVSDNFDSVEIIIKIIEFITKERPTTRSLASLQENLKELLITKKFLLVLDDVWNDANRLQWENLVALLKFGHARSRILVTSRMQSVADMVAKVIEGENDYHKLDGLQENDFLALLNKHAFHGVDPDEYKNLHPIGKQIAKKLGGCPLAAKVMGGVLNYSMDLDYWSKVLKEDVPNFLSGMDDIMAVLRLSYNHLPTNIQSCFRYCSIFPKDYEFEKDELIKMWMGSGLIELKKRGYRPEDVGSEYFNQMVRKSLFDLKLEEFAGRFSKHYYVMHDLLHDLAMSVSEGECLRIEKNSGNVPKTIRHLQLEISCVVSIQEITHLKYLRTLCIIFDDENPDYGDMQIFNETLKRFKSLRLLSLTGKYLQAAPDAIGELIHLRYLSHRQNTTMGAQVPLFPQSTYKLYHLQVIEFKVHTNDLRGIDNNGIYNLINLRYLDTSPGPGSIGYIPSIGKLSFLQELNFYLAREDTGYHINELGNLLNLCKLCIMYMEKLNNPQEAKEAQLSEKEYLKALDLRWSLSDAYSSELYEQILNNLRPHINLENLVIYEYGGARPPVWMSHKYLVNLTTLQLYYCRKLSTLPAFGKFPMLKHLTLNSLFEIKKLDHAFYGNDEGHTFPVLKELAIYDMRELEEWVEVEGRMMHFPCLEILELNGCPKLRGLPSLPPSLRTLSLNNVGMQVLPRIYQTIRNGQSTQSSLSLMYIYSCQNLTSLDGCLLQQHEHTGALSEIIVNDCLELVHLPSRWFFDLKSLKKLRIEACPKIITPIVTQENILPSSLQELSIQNCGLEVPLLGSLRNLALLKELSLVNCPNLTSLPSASVLSALTALSILRIDCCKELVSLGGLAALKSLKSLSIRSCDKLVAISSSQPPLQPNVSRGVNAHNSALWLGKLHIDQQSLLLLEPLRSLELTKELVLNISDIQLPEIWLLQNHSSLQSLTIGDGRNLEHLPASIEKLQVLEELYISNAPILRSLPDFPLTLYHLHIFGCHPLLKERYEKDSGAEWYRIARIPFLNLY